MACFQRACVLVAKHTSVDFLGLHHALVATVLHPASPSHAADARSLLQVREVLVQDCPQAERCHIRARDGPSLTLNHVNNTSGGIQRKSSRPHDAVLQVRSGTFEEKLLLVVFVVEDLLHDSHHQQLEDQWCLASRVPSADGGHHRDTLHALLLHRGNHICGSVRQHCFSNILGLASKRNHHACDILCDDLRYIRCIGDVTLDNGKVGVVKRLSRFVFAT
mmetsp:Transcript_20806/g.45604  ORF Transcript_20806/g.45604 Transcript_20806/m.45604 type:complete len:220 (-) Transcript_20806:348-1007(-)